MDIKSKRKDYRGNAIRVMSQSEQSRNSDWHLLFDYLYYSADISVPTELKEAIHKSGVNLHTVIRERQKIQSEGIFLPTDVEILKRRRKLSSKYAEAYKSN